MRLPAQPAPPVASVPAPPLGREGRHAPRYDVPAPLCPYVHGYTEEELVAPAGAALRLRVSATTEPFLAVVLSGGLATSLGGGTALPPVALIRPQPDAYAVVAEGVVRCFYVHFSPLGPLALLGVEDWGRHARVPSLQDAVGAELSEAAGRWGAALRAAASFSGRAAIADAFLLQRLPEMEPKLAFLWAAVQTIRAADGAVRIGALARALGASPSTVRRCFRALGMPPKRFAQIVRFRRAHHYLHSAPHASVAGVVDSLGYADQAHFVREYHRFAGTSPTGWREEERVVDRWMGMA